MVTIFKIIAAVNISIAIMQAIIFHCTLLAIEICSEFIDTTTKLNEIIAESKAGKQVLDI